MMKNLILLSTLLGLASSPAGAQIELHGFVEAAGGARLGDVSDPPAYWGFSPETAPGVWGPEAGDYTLLESRLQLRGDLYGDAGDAHFALDFLGDQVADEGVDVIVREAWAKFTTMSNNLEVRVGRQPTTWGTGDLLFINDMFPKDWVAFFSGREEQYLKNPVDAARFGIFGLPVNVDVVLVPEFTPDNLPTGERLAFWSPAFVESETKSNEIGNGELAVRMNRYVGSWNWSAYGYVGYWKQPLGAEVDPISGEMTNYYYPELNVWGASTRGGLFGGVAWLEGGYYDSREDGAGDDVFVPNSEMRGMAGYERQWFTDFTGGMQFYAEYMMDHDAASDARDLAIASQIGGPLTEAQLEDMFYLKDELRTLVTLNLRKQWLYQTLTTSAFVYYSPSDKDSYTRLVVSYALNDDVTLTTGANLFTADDHRTQFGMNDENDNVYVRVRYGF